MAPQTATLLLSPAELSYLHTSLSQTPPLRPDGRTPTQFRPLIAETALLPSTNGSARVCWSEGEECIVGIKCEVEGTTSTSMQSSEAANGEQSFRKGDPNWVTLSIEIPGFRDDDPLPVFLGSMLTEALVQNGFLARRLVINSRWHWRIFLDILLLSPPLSYPLPLLSMTTHLALLDTHLPRLISTLDEDPLFDDDWAAAIPLYSAIPLSGNLPSPSDTTEPTSTQTELPPITLLTTTTSNKILFDPSREEIAVADAVIAVSLSSTTPVNQPSSSTNKNPSTPSQGNSYTLLSIRTIDSPARLTPHGLADVDNPATFNTNNNTSNTASGTGTAPAISTTNNNPSSNTTANRDENGVWTPPVGGISRSLIGRIVAGCIGDASLGEAGVAGEVFEGLRGFISSSTSASTSDAAAATA